MKLIRPETISFHASIDEDELRERMGNEVLEQVGGLDANGKRLPGVSVTVRRGASRHGGYTIQVTGPVADRLLLNGKVD